MPVFIAPAFTLGLQRRPKSATSGGGDKTSAVGKGRQPCDYNWVLLYKVIDVT